MRCDQCGCTLMSCQCASGPSNQLIEAKTLVLCNITAVCDKPSFSDSFFDGARGTYWAVVRLASGQRDQLHQTKTYDSSDAAIKAAQQWADENSCKIEFVKYCEANDL